jgi:hypothetical protein
VPERASDHLRRTADVRFLEPPLRLPAITEMPWWHPRHTMDPAHAWLRARIAEIAAELDQVGPAGSSRGLPFGRDTATFRPSGLNIQVDCN